MARIVVNRTEKNKKWYYNPLFLAILPVLLAVWFVPKQIGDFYFTQNHTGLGDNVAGDKVVYNNQENKNLRSLDILESGKDIGKLPNDTYFFEHGGDIDSYIRLGVDVAQGRKFKKNKYYEIQKYNDQMFLVGYVTSETRARIDENKKSGFILYNNKWESADIGMAIPFEDVVSVNTRYIELDSDNNMLVLDIETMRVIWDPEIHD